MIYLYCYWQHYATDREQYATLAEAVERWLDDWRWDRTYSLGILDVERHIFHVPEGMILLDEEREDLRESFGIDVHDWQIEEFPVPEEI